MSSKTPLGFVRSLGARLASAPRLAPWGGALLWIGFIWRMSSRPFTPGGSNFLVITVANLAHAPLFGLLALLVLAGLVSRRPRTDAGSGLPPIAPSQAGLAWLVAVLYGCVDEWHQGRTPGRDSSLGDVVTDAVGAGCVIWIACYVAGTAASETGLLRRLVGGALLCFLAALAAGIGVG